MLNQPSVKQADGDSQDFRHSHDHLIAGSHLLNHRDVRRSVHGARLLCKKLLHQRGYRILPQRSGPADRSECPRINSFFDTVSVLALESINFFSNRPCSSNLISLIFCKPPFYALPRQGYAARIRAAPPRSADIPHFLSRPPQRRLISSTSSRLPGISRSFPALMQAAALEHPYSGSLPSLIGLRLPGGSPSLS